MKKHSATQFDLPGTAAPFNLATETTTDGARVIREKEQQAQDRAAAEAAQLDFVKPFSGSYIPPGYLESGLTMAAWTEAHQNPAKCPKCGNPSKYVRVRHFETMYSIVWHCAADRCSPYYFHTDYLPDGSTLTPENTQ